MRADRLVSLVLELQARGNATASTLAGALEVSVRTIYRDLAALSAAGVPIVAEPGPAGGCRLLDGYRFPLRGLRPEEAEALLILGVPSALRELGLGGAIAAAHHKIRVTAGLPGDGGPAAALIHLDLPQWFRGAEQVPHLRSLAEAVRQHRQVALEYQPDGSEQSARPRVVGPLGLVNKAGTWYLVAVTRSRQVAVFRAGRVRSVRLRADSFERPAGFELAAFWERWSADFAASRSRIAVRLRAAPQALMAFSEVFGRDVQQALDAALPADEQGWRELALTFEHALAAAHRLAGFGGAIEVLSPPSVRAELLASAHGILARYQASQGDATRQLT